MKSYTLSRIKTILFLTIFMSVSSICSAASIYLHNATDNSNDTLPGYVHKGQDYVSLAHLCTYLGFTWKWNRYTERFTATSENASISFIQDNPFYQIEDSTFQLPYPPVRIQENLYLYAQAAASIFSRREGSRLTWSKDISRLTIGAHWGKKDGNTVTTEGTKIPEKKDPEKEGFEKEKPDKKEPALESKKKIAEAPKDVKNDITKEADTTGTKEEIKTVVIDPGHGGKDPGAIGQNGVQEKDVVLSISLALRDVLKENTRLRVYMTRSTDEFIPLRQRTKFANEKKADLFISIHANSIAGNKKRKNYVKGYKVYFLSQAKNEEDKLAAMIENSVIELEEDIQKGDYLQNILIDMANNEFLTESQDISILIAESFGEALTKVSALQKGVGQANFWVLNGAYMPSVLVEACFISNPNEEKLLTNNKFQKKIAEAISDAVVQFKKKYEAEL